MLIVQIIILAFSAFLGYLIGRVGDYISDTWMNDPAWSPHHWIYGIVVAAIALLFFKNSWELWLIAFGFGIFVSDLSDFLHLKFIGKDNKPIDQRKFWHIN